ncbi:FMN-binding negative transcriptional regulator [Sphingomonas sp. DT-204]|uniref:FMN-binding negative transcriptional regulator n=1 Tax=Sphingomonas sp. DT-204 TaxID=3396166 RepID=UPI003F19859B
MRSGRMSGAHDFAALIEAHPLAWIVAPGEAPFAIPLPVRPVRGHDGTLVAIRGHFPRHSPLTERLRADPRAAVLAMGPQGYVSPSWLSDRTQAPTWNYAAARFDVVMTLIDDDDWIAAHLHDLVTAMEQERPCPWSLGEMGARYTLLASRIIGFEARVRTAAPLMKLGQGERDVDYVEIVAGLGGEGAHDLLDWMAAFNPGR